MIFIMQEKFTVPTFLELLCKIVNYLTLSIAITCLLILFLCISVFRQHNILVAIELLEYLEIFIYLRRIYETYVIL